MSHISILFVRRVKSRVVSLADHDNRDFGHWASTVHPSASLPNLGKLFLEDCTVLSFRDTLSSLNDMCTLGENSTYRHDI